VERYQREHGVSFELVLANAESLAYDDASFDLAVSDYGTSLWCDHRRWLPRRTASFGTAAGSSSLRTAQCSWRAHRSTAVPRRIDSFGEHAAPNRVEFPDDDAVEFHLAHGEWVRARFSRLRRGEPFEVKPQPLARSRFDFVSAEWARRCANRRAVEDAGLSFILGMKVPEVPYQIDKWHREHPDAARHRGEDQRVQRPPPAGVRVEHHPELAEVQLAPDPRVAVRDTHVAWRRPNPHRWAAKRCSVSLLIPESAAYAPAAHPRRPTVTLRALRPDRHDTAPISSSVNCRSPPSRTSPAATAASTYRRAVLRSTLARSAIGRDPRSTRRH
jgi:hypothetical protein